MTSVNVVGAGLAGCECAYQLAKRGFAVRLYEMKPQKKSPAHKSDMFAELVCSNSLRSDRLTNGAGLLKEELRRLGSLIIEAADACRVPAGGALAVNRTDFSEYITAKIKDNPNITVVESCVDSVPDGITVIATGPLTDGGLLASIEGIMGEPLHFFDAAAPIITSESIDFTKAFEGSRYDRGSDYVNCPMTDLEYFTFIRELVNAETAELHGFEDKSVFEGCMPVEVMAKRGEMTLAFGPLKPIGLRDSRDGATGKRPFAVVQLRKEDEDGKLYNIVGFQTNLKFGEQKRVFSLIPGLENAEFVRYGVMHRNTFLNSPGKLDYNYCVKNCPNLYFAGQITGVEGYVESVASGLTVGVGIAAKLSGKTPIDFTRKTAIGALSHYVSEYAGSDFQPQNINFGIIDDLGERIRNKQDRYMAISNRALSVIDELVNRGELM